MTTIGIIGYGIVGKSVHHAFKDLCDFRIYDINPNISQNSLLETVKDSDLIYICVPTPMRDDGSFDSTIIDSVVDSVASHIKETEKILIIKSTTVPGTVQSYIDKYPDTNIVFCPEFLTERMYLLDAISPSRIIFGMNTPIKFRIQAQLSKLYEERFPGTKIFFTEPTTAELAKYVANTFFCVKISFFNEIYEICEKLEINYKDILAMTVADGRIGNSHMQVPGHDGNFGYGGTCFPKDINALIKKVIELKMNPIMLLAAWEKNLEVRKKRDWEKTDGDTSNE